MHIAICDDNPQDAGLIRFALEDLGGSLQFDCYAAASELMQDIRGGKEFDVVFMDIYIGQENGMDAATELHRLRPQTQFIFCTSSRDYAVDAFRIRAADYLVKPFTEHDVVKAFARVSLQNRKKARERIPVKTGNDILLYDPENVIRIESDRHYTKLVLKNGKTDRLLINYSDITVKFQAGFLEIRRGVSVNMHCIEGIRDNTVSLSDGSSFTISRSKKDAVIPAYSSWLMEQSGNN